MLLEYKNFFSEIECDSIIKFCSREMKPIASSNPFNNKAEFFFTPENNLTGMVFNVNDVKIKWAIKRLCDELNLDIEKLEHPRFQKYEIGGSYRNHYDFILIDQKYSNYHLSRGGQRLKSLIIYLNDDFEGGETVFPKKDLIIKPEIGKVVEWTNVIEKSDTQSKESYDWSTLHGSTPIISGNKFTLIIFERERKFIGTPKEWLNRFPSKPSKNENKVSGFHYEN